MREGVLHGLYTGYARSNAQVGPKTPTKASTFEHKLKLFEKNGVQKSKYGVVFNSFFLGTCAFDVKNLKIIKIFNFLRSPCANG